jgi:hypothetical protein
VISGRCTCESTGISPRSVGYVSCFFDLTQAGPCIDEESYGLIQAGIVPGTIVESHRDADKEEDKLLNVCYFIDPEGNIAGKYIKKNLWYVQKLKHVAISSEVHRMKRPYPRPVPSQVAQT